MKDIYRCPHCRHILNPNVKVILGAEIDGQKGLVLLSATPGDYKLIADPELALVEGRKAAFSCPICQKSLESPRNSNFCELVFEHGGPAPGRMEFSRTYGEHATFIVDGEEIMAYGEDADDYRDVNFFGH